MAAPAFAAGLQFVSVPKDEAQAMIKQSDTIKISSNAHSMAAAALGIHFEWNVKQKDDCLLTVQTLANGSFFSFKLLIQNSSDYSLLVLNGPGVYEIAKGDKNINTVYVVDAKLVAPCHCPSGVCVGNVCVVCEPGTNKGCDVAAGEVCLATADGQGQCLPPDVCTNDFSCPTGWICFNGTCIPACTVGNNAPCQPWETCVGYGGSTTPGDPGYCIGAPECEVGDNTPCEPWETCLGYGGSTTPGDPGYCLGTPQCTVGNNTPCQPWENCLGYGGSTTPGDPGYCLGVPECIVGDNSPCAPWQTCVGYVGNTTPGDPGYCADALVCNANEDCASGICVYGVCVYCDPVNNHGCDMAAGEVCFATADGMGQCIPLCGATFPCPLGFICWNGVCIPASCTNDAECPGTDICLMDRNGVRHCVPEDSCTVGAKCAAAETCADNVALPDGIGTCLPADCPTTPCANGWWCDAGTCKPQTCNVDADCNGTDVCLADSNGLYHCVSAGSCIVNSNFCAAGEVCVAAHGLPDGVGMCVSTLCGAANPCPPGSICVNGACIIPACSTNADCAYGLCVGGVCVTCDPNVNDGCNMATEMCHATTDGMGVCLPSVCNTTDDCPGSICVNAACVPAKCDAVTPCAVGLVCSMGQCLPVGCPTTPCANGWWCDAGTCKPQTGCNVDADCVAGWWCDYGTCRP